MWYCDSVKCCRMIHRLFTIASAFSLALCITTAILCARSYRTGDQWQWMDRGDGRKNDHFNALSVEGGCAAFERFPCTYGHGEMWHFKPTPRSIAEPPDYKVHRHALGFYLLGQPEGPTRGVVVPLWAIIAAAALLPSYHAAHRISRKRRFPSGQHCQKCGYDLRASKDRCPECGTDISRKTPGECG